MYTKWEKIAGREYPNVVKGLIRLLILLFKVYFNVVPFLTTFSLIKSDFFI